MIPIASPFIGDEEINSVIEVLKSNQLASGEVVLNFEYHFSNYIGVDFGIATSSGTTALHVALQALGLEPGSQVVTTPFSFIATANAILYNQLTPVFVDIDPLTFNISPVELERLLKEQKNIKAIIVVHLYGQSCEMDEIMALANKFNIKVIEDCAQAHGALYKNKKVGSIGDISIFSFYPTKNMTTGEGGMICTSDREIADTCKRLINHGQTAKYYHKYLGYNYRMTNIQAAIGVHQLQRLDLMNKQRAKNAQFFLSHIENDLIRLPHIKPENVHVFHQFTLRTSIREKLISSFDQAGIGYGIHYPVPIHRQPIYKEIIGEVQYEQTELAAQEVISIPVHPQLTQSQLLNITKTINEFEVD
jgi:perosamine synthetase